MSKIIQVVKKKIDTGRTLLRIDEVKHNVDSLRAVVHGIQRIKEVNEASSLQDLSQISFEEMLRIWEIEEDQIAHVIKNFTLEITFYCVLAILSFISLITSHGELMYVVSFFLVMPLMLGISLMRYWRMQCLEKRQFVPFKTWVRSCYKV